MRLKESSLGRWTIISAESLLSGSRDRRNRSCLHIDAAHHVIEPFDKVQVAIGIEAQFVRFIQCRGSCEATVAGVARFAASSDGANGAVARNAPHDMVADIAEIKRSVRTAHQAKRIVELGRAGLAAVAGITGVSGSGK